MKDINEYEEFSSVITDHMGDTGNQVDELVKLLDSKKGESIILKRLNSMCEESLDPHEFESWEKVKKALINVRSIPFSNDT